MVYHLQIPVVSVQTIVACDLSSFQQLLGALHDFLEIGRKDREEGAEKTAVLDLQFVTLFTLYIRRIAANQKIVGRAAHRLRIAKGNLRDGMVDQPGDESLVLPRLQGNDGIVFLRFAISCHHTQPYRVLENGSRESPCRCRRNRTRSSPG